MNKDQIKGRIHEVIGKTKEITGKITGNIELKVEGQIQKKIGKSQADFGDLNNDLKKWRLKRT